MKLTEVMEQVNGMINTVLPQVESALGKFGPEDSPAHTRMLTPKDKVRIFMNMSESDMAELRNRVGDEQFSRYITHMRGLAGEVNW